MNEVADIGHNRPPADLDGITAYLDQITADDAKRITDILGGVDRMPEKIEDEETANKAVAFVKQIRETAKNADNTRTTVKKPYLEAGKAVDAFFKKNFTEPLDRAKRTVEARLTPYVYQKRREAEEEARREREKAEAEARKAAEEAARLAEEGKTFAADEATIKAEEAAREAEKAAKGPSGPTMRSDLGATASTSTLWDVQIDDTAALDLEAIRPFIPRAALETACRAFVRNGGRELRGARIFEKSRLNVR